MQHTGIFLQQHQELTIIIKNIAKITVTIIKVKFHIP